MNELGSKAVQRTVLFFLMATFAAAAAGVYAFLVQNDAALFARKRALWLHASSFCSSAMHAWHFETLYIFF